MHRSRPVLSLALILASAACGDSGTSCAADVGGTLIVALPAQPASLLPIFIRGLQDKEIADFIFEPLAEIGDDLNSVGSSGFKPRIAKSWTWSADSLSIAFHIDSLAVWHDGRPVRSNDVRYTIAAYTDTALGAPAATSLAVIDSVSTPDPLTATFWFKHRYPHQFFDAVYHTLILPQHLLDTIPKAQLRTSAISRAPIGSGPFRFVLWEAGQRIEVVADTADPRGRPKLDRVIWSFVPDPNAMYTRVLAGEADVAEPILNHTLMPQLAGDPKLSIKTGPGFDYGFLIFNLREPRNRARPHPVLGDKRMRHALTMAIDRATITRGVFDTLAVASVGPMVRAQRLADTTIALIAFDTAHARALLDSLGWRDGNADGVREKAGRPLRLNLRVPSSSRVRQQFAVLLQAAFKNVGAQIDIESGDFGAMMGQLSAGDFDMTLSALHADPAPGALRQSWGSGGAASKGGNNFGEYMSSAFDAHLDTALASMDPARERAHLRKAYETIIEDAPAAWLYELRWSAVVSKRFRTTGIRPDAWWGGVDEWTIPLNERIPRDRIGLRDTTKK